MGDIGQRIVELLFAQRPAAPVGEPRRLVDGRTGDPRDKLVIGDRFAKSANHRRNLRVEQRVRNQVTELDHDFDVLAGSVKHLDHRSVRHQVEKRFEINAFRQRIDNAFIFRTGHLDQAEFGPIGGLAQELGVNGDKVVFGEAGAKGGKRLGRCNHVHVWHLAGIFRFVLCRIAILDGILVVWLAVGRLGCHPRKHR
jgi:hypothetical protein